jgi:hypothetical protein
LSGREYTVGIGHLFINIAAVDIIDLLSNTDGYRAG